MLGELPAITDSAQSEVFDLTDLTNRCRIVYLGDIYILGADTCLLICAMQVTTLTGARLAHSFGDFRLCNPAPVLVRDGDRVVEAFGDVGGGQDVGYRALGDDETFSDEDRMRGGARNFLEVMGYEDAGTVGVVRTQTVERCQKLFARRQIETCCGLVEEQQFRLGHEGTRDEGAAALSLGQIRPQEIQSRPHAKSMDEFLGTRNLRISRRPPGEKLGGVGQTGEDDIPNRQRRLNDVSRVHMTDVSSQLPHVDTPQPMAENVDRTCCGVRSCSQQ